MDGFAKYQEMQSKGALPQDVYLAGKADGLDAITLLRLLRQVFGLSLPEAKQVTGANDVWVAKQKVVLGATVYWEGWSTEDGYYLMQARVKEIVGDSATLEGHRRFRVTNEGIEEVPIGEARIESLRVSHLEKPLSDRFAKLLSFVEDLSQLRSDDAAKRKAI